MKSKILLAVVLVAMYGTLNAMIQRFENEKVITYNASRDVSGRERNAAYFKESGKYINNSNEVFAVTPAYPLYAYPLYIENTLTLYIDELVDGKSLFDRLQNEYDEQERNKKKDLNFDEIWDRAIAEMSDEDLNEESGELEIVIAD